ncbi:NUDIX hydrolase [Propionicimonas sp.]|uniref:NUDIX hydrolase n=1 Tax=Propionicimonas sp. TaxID=1955623 RepID=UPI0039E5D59E
MDELVALYDEDGKACGSAPRSRMRAENLHHAATAVVVRDPLGRIYVHRRTNTKDVYPGRRDFAAGGVIAAGEDPDTAALRELAEELGITGVPLTPLASGSYADDHTSYHGFCYTVTWAGPIYWQPEEVAGGEWVSPESLAAAIAADPDDFMPDTLGLLGGWLSEVIVGTTGT